MPGCGCHGGGYSWKHALLAVAAPQLTERDSCVDSRGMCVNGRVRKGTDVVPEALPEDMRHPSVALYVQFFAFTEAIGSVRTALHEQASVHGAK